MKGVNNAAKNNADDSQLLPCTARYYAYIL